MKLNETGNWIAIVAGMALVALTGTTLTAAGSGMRGLAVGGAIGIVALVVLSAIAIAIVQWRTPRQHQSTASNVTHLPRIGQVSESEAA